MSSKNFTVRLPENLQAMLLRHVCEPETSNFIRAAIGFFKSIPGAIDADPTIAGAVVELNFSDDKSFSCRLSRKELSSPYLMKETRDRVVRVLQVMRRCDKDILDFKFAFE